MALHDQVIGEFPHTSKRVFARAVGAGMQLPSTPVKPSPETLEMTFPSTSGTGSNMPSFHDFLHGMADHFRLRATSWIMALTTVIYGVVLLQNPHAFDIPSRPFQYVYLLRLASQPFWGWLCVTLGCFRLSALIVNGTIPSFVWSPHMRTLGSFITVFVWFQILFGAFHESVMNLALPSYLTFFLLDVFNVYIATLEIERRDK